MFDQKNEKALSPEPKPELGQEPGADLREKHGAGLALENHDDNVRMMNELINKAQPGESVSISVAAGREIVLPGREADSVVGAQALVIKGMGDKMFAQTLSGTSEEIMIRRAGGEPEPIPAVEGGDVRMTPIQMGDALIIGGAEFKLTRPPTETLVTTREELTQAIREQEPGRAVIIGRKPTFGPDEDGIKVSLPDSNNLSRSHARIEHGPEGSTIADLGSLNGVYVNGERISSPTPITPSDTVLIGKLVFQGSELMPSTAQEQSPEPEPEPEKARLKSAQELVDELLERGPTSLRDFHAIAREYYDQPREEKMDFRARYEEMRVIEKAAVKWALSPHEPRQLEALANLEADPQTAGLAAALRQRQYPPTDSGGNTMAGGMLNLPEKFSSERFMKEERGDIVAVHAHAPTAEWESRADAPRLDVGGHSEGQFMIEDDKYHSASFGVTRTVEPDGEVRHTILQQAIQSCVRTSVLMLALDAAANHGVQLQGLDRLVSGVTQGGTSDHETARSSLRGALRGSGLKAEITYGGFESPEILDGHLKARGPAMVSVGGDIGGHVIVVDKVNRVPSTDENPSGFTVTIREPYHGWRIDVPWENLKRTGPHDLLQAYPEKRPARELNPAQEKVASLESGSLTLGRSPDSDIRLVGDGVSRRHATITRTGEGLMLRDLGSLNGTFVNGVRVPPTGLLLESGDKVVLGSSAGNEHNQLVIP